MREMLTERDVKAEVKKMLTAHKWTYWMPPMNGYGQTGVSDFCALRAGVFMAVETKFGANKLRPMQAKFLNEVMCEQGFAFVVNERTLPVLEQFLTEFDRATAAVTDGQKPTQEMGGAMLEAIRILSEPYA
jgi:hypothetical protein